MQQQPSLILYDEVGYMNSSTSLNSIPYYIIIYIYINTILFYYY